MPEIPTQSQPTSIQKSINWKRILIVAVIAAVVIGLGVLILVLLQPKPETTSTVTTKKATPSAKMATPSAEKDETADWKTVVNDVFGYSIKYPTGWSALRCNNSGNDNFGNDNFTDYEIKSSNSETSTVLVSIDYCASGARTRIVIYQYGDGTYSDKINSWDKYGPTDYKTYQKTKLRVNDRDAIRIYAVTKQIDPPSGPPGVYYLEAGMQEGVIFIQYIIDAPSNEALVIDYIQWLGDELNPPQQDYSDILEKMVSTLKFLD